MGYFFMCLGAGSNSSETQGFPTSGTTLNVVSLTAFLHGKTRVFPTPFLVRTRPPNTKPLQRVVFYVLGEQASGKPSVFPILPPRKPPGFRPFPNPPPNQKTSFCAWGRVRTADPSLFRRMLYQLSYPSKT